MSLSASWSTFDRKTHIFRTRFLMQLDILVCSMSERAWASNWSGLERIGVNWNGLEWVGVDCRRLEWIGEVGVDWSGLGWIGVDWNGLE